MTRYVRSFLPFGKSEVFCQYSVVLCRSYSTFRCIFDVFLGRKLISTSYTSAILKVVFRECLMIQNKPSNPLRLQDWGLVRRRGKGKARRVVAVGV